MKIIIYLPHLPAAVTRSVYATHCAAPPPSDNDTPDDVVLRSLDAAAQHSNGAEA